MVNQWLLNIVDRLAKTRRNETEPQGSKSKWLGESRHSDWASEDAKGAGFEGENLVWFKCIIFKVMVEQPCS